MRRPGAGQMGGEVDLIRRGPVLIGAAVILPLIIFVAIQVAFSAREQRRVVEGEAVASAEKLIGAADAQLSRTLGALDALATVPAFAQGDLRFAYSRARDIASLNPDWVTVTLTDLDSGREIFDLRRPLDSAGPSPGAVGRPPANPPRRAFVGDVGGAGRGCPCALAHRFIRGPGGHLHLLTAVVDPRPFQNLVAAEASDMRVVAIVDRKGDFVGRSIDFKERLGTQSSEYVRLAIATGRGNGIYPGTTLEGFANYTGFARSKLSGWSAHIAFEPNLLDSPRLRSLAAAGLAALAALGLASFLIWFTTRQLAEGRRVEERLQDAQKLEALGQLTGGIAHDFNNLLTPILGGLDLLVRKDSLDDRSRRLAEAALICARKAAKLTAQLLAFSRRQRMEIKPVDLKALLDELEPLLRQSVGASTRIEIDLDEAARGVMSDGNQLELALLNLVVNARDAMPDGGTIRIAASLHDGKESGDARVRLIVADGGAGMAPEVARRATEPFFTTKLPGSGTGLGLAQVYGIVRQSGGSLAIDSEAGKGTIVTILLPGCVLPPATDPVQAGTGGDSGAANLRVLVCDDDDAVRSFVARALEEAGYAVEAVADGRTAVEAIRNGGHDVLVVDFAMQGMNGAEVVRQVRSLATPPALLMITGYADTEMLGDIGESVPVLRKPFEAAALLAAVRRALGSRPPRRRGMEG
jgi:signal transduction histidine kinase